MRMIEVENGNNMAFKRTININIDNIRGYLNRITESTIESVLWMVLV